MKPNFKLVLILSFFAILFVTSCQNEFLEETPQNQEETLDKVKYIAYKQHFFASILMTETPFEKAVLKSNKLVIDENKDTIFVKQFNSKMPLAFSNGEVNYKMNWYFGPTDYKTLKSYEGKNLDKVIPLGWGIFGWINKSLFIPLFSLLSGFFPYGIAIIIMTILVRLVLSPVLYKSYLSQAKMKILKQQRY